MRIIYIFLLINSFSSSIAQTNVSDNSIVFQKKNNSKTIEADLPLAIKIKTKDRVKKDVLLVGVSDSTLTTLRFVLDKHGAITDEAVAIVDRYWRELSKIGEDPNLTEEEKKNKREQLYKLVYTDSVSYHLSEIKKIEFAKKDPSQLAFYSSFSLYISSGIAAMIGVLELIGLDDANNLTASEKNVFRLVSIAGFAGLAANLFWMKRIGVNVINLKRWNIYTPEQ